MYRRCKDPLVRDHPNPPPAGQPAESSCRNSWRDPAQRWISPGPQITGSPCADRQRRLAAATQVYPVYHRPIPSRTSRSRTLLLTLFKTLAIGQSSSLGWDVCPNRLESSGRQTNDDRNTRHTLRREITPGLAVAAPGPPKLTSGTRKKGLYPFFLKLFSSCQNRWAVPAVPYSQPAVHLTRE